MWLTIRENRNYRRVTFIPPPKARVSRRVLIKASRAEDDIIPAEMNVVYAISSKLIEALPLPGEEGCEVFAWRYSVESFSLMSGK